MQGYRFLSSVVEMRGLIVVILFSCTLFFSTRVYSGEPVSQVLIAYRDDITIHKILLNGLMASLKDDYFTEKKVKTIGLTGDKNTWPLIGEKKADLAVALGDSALKFVLEQAEIRRGIYLLISNPEIKESADRKGIWTGTTLWVPLGIQLSVIEEMYPNLKRIGIVVGKETLPRLKREINQVKSDRTLPLTIVTIDRPRELLKEISTLFPKIDAFLFYPDPIIFNSATIGEILRLQKEFLVPVVAPAPAIAQMGACIAVYYDLNELLREIVHHITRAPFEDFDKECCVKVSINVDTTKMLNADWLLTPAKGKEKISFIKN